MVDAFGGTRATIKPPERGIFPLDHDHQCKEMMLTYLDCLRSNKYDHIFCRDLSKRYLSCRMENDLMMKEDLSNLGLGDDLNQSSLHRIDASKEKMERDRNGYIAGIDVRPGRTWFRGS